MPNLRLDKALMIRGIVRSRSQAESYIRLGQIKLNGQVAAKPGQLVRESDQLELTASEQYVSRAGLKLASVAAVLGLDFRDKVVLDVGSSTGGFTDYALQHGAKKVIAVDVGSHQLHPSLRINPHVELHEQTDIRSINTLSELPDIVLIDVSFISLREIIPCVIKLSRRHTQIVAMVKPQFEAGRSQINKGVIKNERVRRDILQAFEVWVRQYCTVKAKADSVISGAKGNTERFYLCSMV